MSLPVIIRVSASGPLHSSASIVASAATGYSSRGPTRTRRLPSSSIARLTSAPGRMPFEDAQSFGSDTPRLEYPSFWTFRVSSSMIHVSTELHQIRTPFDRWPPPPMAGRLMPAIDRGQRIRRCPRVPIESSQSLMSPDGIGLKQMDRQVDVLVVGAGPTGSTAAKYAAHGGADVLLIEKRSEIGTPVRCGEGVAKRWLEEIGLAPSREFICHEVDGARIIAP